MTRTTSLPLLGHANPFASRLIADGQQLVAAELRTLQLNLGKMCNLACHHCHVESGPKRREIMTWLTIERIVDWVDTFQDRLNLEIVDLTGGAPEMNPHFRRAVIAFRRRGLHVLDRCNLTILLEEGYEDLIDFFAQHQIEIVASLPCYLEENVDAQRGRGVFDRSIQALQSLNAAGYGKGELRLDLIFNPVGYGLPPQQNELEQAYRCELSQRYGIIFDRLWTITNMPIKRFEHALRRDGMFDRYMDQLVDAHNCANVDSVMCRSLISVGWQGSVYDCDFNQMLQMPIDPATFGPGDDEHIVERDSRKLWNYTPEQLRTRKIRTDFHCFGCTAGAGSSCTGALAGGEE